MGAAESKPRFRESVQALKSLNLLALDETDDEKEAVAQESLCRGLLSSGLSPESLFTWFSADDVKEIRQAQPANLGVLVFQVLSSIAKATEVDATGNTFTSRGDVPELMACLRVLSRVMPHVVEAEWQQTQHAEQAGLTSDGSGLSHNKPSVLSYLSNEFQRPAAVPAPEDPSSLPDDAAPSQEDAPRAPSVPNGVGSPLELYSTLASALVNLAFCEPFTVPAQGLQCGLRVWAPSMTEPRLVPVETTAARAELLRCLVATCTAEALLNSPQSYHSARLPFTHALLNLLAPLNANASARQATETAVDLFTSLFNTVICYKPGGWWRNISKDVGSQLLDYSIHAMLVLLDLPNQNPSPKLWTSVIPGVEMQTQQPQGVEETGVFKQLLGSVSDPRQFKIIFYSMVELLNNPLIVMHSSIMQDRQKVDSYPELLVLLWRLLECNSSFLAYVSTGECQHGMPLLAVLLQHIYIARNDPSKIGLVQNASYILLLLSSRRDFAVALNDPVTTSNYPCLELPSSFHGRHVDALVHVVFRCVVSPGCERLVPLYTTLLTVLLNVTPYSKTISMHSSERLMKMLEVFSSRQVLLAAPKNYQWAKLVLMILNNLVQYQIDGQYHLTYAVVRKSDIVTTVATMELEQPNTTPTNEDTADADEDATETDDEAQFPDVDIPSDAAVFKGTKWSASHGTATSQGWEPDETWMRTVKAELPTSVLLLLIQRLVPIVEAFVQRTNQTADNAVVEFLRNTTMVGLVPSPPPIMVHRYAASAATEQWMSAYTWGLLYLRHQEMPHRLFDGLDSIRMVRVLSTRSS